MSRVGMVSIDLGKELTKLQGEQRKHADAASELTARVLSENRDFNADEQKAYDEARGLVVSLGKRVEQIKEVVDMRSKLEDTPKPKTTEDGEQRGAGRDAGEEDDDDPTGDGLTREERSTRKAEEKRYRRAYRSFLRWGVNGVPEEDRSLMAQRAGQVEGMNAQEKRALSAVTGNVGGYTVPQEFNAQIVRAMLQYSSVMDSGAQMVPTSSGADMPWPTVNDTAVSGELLAENTQAALADPAFGTVTLKSFIFSSKIVLIPLTLLQDTAVDIESLIGSLLGERIGRALESYFTTGTGTGQPQGVVPFSTLGKTAAGAAAITYGETIDLQHSVDPAYRALGGCKYMFKDATFAYVRKLLDSSGRPIWQPQATSGAAAAAPATLNGSPYKINQSMAGVATGQKSMLFGDFSHYKIRQVRGITLMRLQERYADYLQVGFLAHCRFDGRGVNAGTNPITHLLHP